MASAAATAEDVLPLLNSQAYLEGQAVGEARALVADLCRHFYNLGWVTGTGGSITVKVHDDAVPKPHQLIVMSPSGVQKERMVPEDMYVMSGSGAVLSAPSPKPYPHKPPKCSDCAPLFMKAYLMRNAGACIHSHGMESCLITMINPSAKEFRITHMEMIKGIQGHGYYDELVVPIIENTAHERELTESLSEAMAAYPKATAVLVRNHGIYVWGDSWINAKTQAECYHYLFDAALKLHQLGIDYSSPGHGPVNSPSSFQSKNKHLSSGLANGVHPPDPSRHCIVLDIEGTTTPITFVTDVLFPYARDNVRKHLSSTYDSDETKDDIKLLRAQVEEDLKQGLFGSVPIPPDDALKEKVIDSLVDNVESMIKSDRKITPSPSDPAIDPSYLGFFLISDESLIRAAYDSQQNPDPNSYPDCVLMSYYVKTIIKFSELSPPLPGGAINRSFPISHPDEYSLYFANCASGSAVTMSVHTEMYNTRADGTHDFLSVGQSPVPSIYTFFAVAYAAFLGIWIYLTLFQNRLSSHKIHHLMAGLLLSKALYLVFAAEDLHYIRKTGTPHGWDIPFYLFQFLKGVLLFTVIVLIGTGWSFLKPFLQEREKNVIMFVIPLQIVANIASVVIGETGPFIKEWVTWNQVFLLIDIVCCCAVMFPIIWSIRSLRETSKTDGKAARNLMKLTLFRQFYIVVIGYLYFTRIVVYALKTITSYKFRWVSVAAEETVSLVFYLFMFYMFRPVEKNQYFMIDDDEEAAAELALREEGFEL